MKLFKKKSGTGQDTASFAAVGASEDMNQTPPEKRSRKGLIAGCILGGAAFLAAVVFGVAAMCVKNVTTIYPNVSMGTYELGGFSMDEAVDTLTRAGWENLDNTALTVDMPGQGFTLSYKDIGMKADAESAARIAYEYGRDGNLFSDTWAYIVSLVAGRDLFDRVFDDPDEDHIAGIVKEAVAEAQLSLMNGVEVDIENETVSFIKGASYIHLDEDAVYDLVMEAVRSGNFGTVEYEPKAEVETELDVDQLREQICTEPQDAYYDKETDEIVEEVPGVEFETGAAQAAWEAAQMGETVEFDIQVTMPEVTAEFLESILFQDLLAEKGTSLSGSSANRLNNVELAAKAINGIVLMPGEQLSYNEALGQRTEENGYKPAGAYANGEVVQEVGGGICQVSSTLYYCTLVSNLQIDVRVNHYFPVAYVSPGYDATVSWKSPDFKFTNDREYPIKLVSFVENGQLFVEIWGTDDGTYTELSYASWLIYTNEEYPETATGYKAQAYRWVYDAETHELIEKKSEGVSTYHYHEEDIDWPEPSPSPEPSPEPSPSPSPSPEPTDPWAPVSPSPEVPTEVSPEISPETTPEATPETTPVQETTQPQSTDAQA